MFQTLGLTTASDQSQAESDDRSRRLTSHSESDILLTDTASQVREVS